MSVQIITGDCREVLRSMADQSIHCAVTSPPYFGLRDYGVDGQMGLEATPAEFVAGMVEVFREVRRVLRDDGTLWLNLGDSYAGSWGNYGGQNKGKGDGQREITVGTSSMSKAYDGKEKWRPATSNKLEGLKPKDLMGIPWRVAFALQADGWYLRQDIIWSKPNPMPESVTDRCTKAHEYLFMMSKSARYYYDAGAIKEPAVAADIGAMDGGAQRNKDGSKANDGRNFRPDKQRGHGRRHAGLNDRWDAMEKADQCSGFRNKRSVWTVATQPYAEAHFATFPPTLIEPCIKAGCPEITCGKCGTALDSSYAKRRSGTNGTPLQDMQVVRREGGTGSPQPRAQLLQQGVRLPLDGEEPEYVEGLHHHVQGLPDADEAGSPERDTVRIRDGASLEYGSEAGPAITADRGRPSQGRESAEQRSGKLGSVDKDQPRQASETKNRNGDLSPLRGQDNNLALCPSCGASLDEVGTPPGLVLDCFGGAGTTGLVADRLQRNAILIELNPTYAEMARNRLSNDGGMFAEVA